MACSKNDATKEFLTYIGVSEAVVNSATSEQLWTARARIYQLVSAESALVIAFTLGLFDGYTYSYEQAGNVLGRETREVERLEDKAVEELKRISPDEISEFMRGKKKLKSMRTAGRIL